MILYQKTIHPWHADYVCVDLTVASRVLSKRAHVLSNAKLTVRKPACKDPWRLLLRGVNPTTSQELVELYVENMMGMDMDDYTLYPSPGRDLVLVHFHQTVNKG